MNEIAIVENRHMTAAEIRANVNLIQEVMQSVMKKNVHYGTIPGTQKPTLYKAGSEKILSTFRIAVELEVDDLSTHDCFRYRVKARGVIPTGEIVGCGIGECSTDEEKYKWRGVVCPAEWDATPEDRKRIKYSRPSDYNKEGITQQIRTNPADLANTVLKMAKKRAQIDLTLTATGASDVFDQDIEDLPKEIREGMCRGEQKQGKPEVKQPQQKQPTDNGDKATEGQVKMLNVKLKQAGVGEAEFKAHYKIESVSDLPKSQVNAAIAAIGAGQIKPETESTGALPEVCSNCGETLDINGKGHHPDCPNGE